MIVRAATLADLPALLQVEAECFPEAERWGEVSWCEELTGGDRLVLVADDSGEVRGSACFSVVAEVADLNRVAVRPDARRRGLAGELVRTGLTWAASAGGERVLLEVAESNAPARTLYSRIGFRQIAHRRRYYPGGGDALVLALDLDPKEGRHE